MATGDGDTLAAAQLSEDPDSHTGFTGLAGDIDKTEAFWRGFRNCCQGNTYSTGWSTDRRYGYKAAQALGLFNLTI